MSDEEQESGISLGLFDGFLEMSEDEMLALRRLSGMAEWEVLRNVLKGIDDSMTTALRNREASIEEIRFAQGISAGVGRLAEIVENDSQEWYDARADESSDSQGNSEDTE